MDTVEASIEALNEIVQRLPHGGRTRSGQQAMTRAIAEALRDSAHILIQAGTGVGKTLAYLLPAVMSGRRTVVATFTKALQDQMVEKELPFLAAHLGQVANKTFKFAEVKGWNNYLCLLRLQQIRGAMSQGQLDGLAEHAPEGEIKQILDWARNTTSGDKADLPFSPKSSTWRAVSIRSEECLRNDCPHVASCFPMQARQRAANADVIVANHALYAIDLKIGGTLLGGHELVIFDEAHQIEDSFSNAFGFELTGERFKWLADLSRPLLGNDPRVDRLAELAGQLTQNMRDHGNARVHTGEAAHLARTLELAESRLEALLAAVAPEFSDRDLDRRRKSLIMSAHSLQEGIQQARLYLAGPSDLTLVGWIESSEGSQPVLKFAPLDIASVLAEHLWPQKVAVLTSATLPGNIVERLGLSKLDPRLESVESPFDYENQTLLYCPTHLPNPSDEHEAWVKAVHTELASLITSAGGRTLALFTSYKSLNAARDFLSKQIDLPLLCQGDMPEKRLLEEFAATNEASLLGTRRFWQGVDVPGQSLTLVIIDRLPFPSPNEHLIKARSLAANPMGWWTIELPIGATRLAQGAGRLVRREDDYGVVAVLDPRLATHTYSHALLASLPRMRRTTDSNVVTQFLQTATEAEPRVQKVALPQPTSLAEKAAPSALKLGDLGAGTAEWRAIVDELHPMAYQRWTESEDELLRSEVSRGDSVPNIAIAHARRNGAISSRIKKLNLRKTGGRAT